MYVVLRNSSNKMKSCKKNCQKYAVLLSGYFSCLFTCGFAFNMSVLYVEFLEEFGKNKSQTSLVQTVCVSVLCIAGFPSGILITRFGTQKIGIAAGILVSVGLISSYFATSMEYLIVSIGTITGLGCAAVTIAAPTCVGQYFDGIQRHVALAIVSLGSASGAVLFPLLINILVFEYTWRGCLLLLGGTTLNLIPLAGLLKNPDFRSSCNNDKSEDNYEEKEINQAKYNNDNENGKVSGSNVFPSKREKQSKVLTLLAALRVLLGNKMYLFHMCAVSISLSAINSLNIIMIDFLEHKNFSRDEAVEIYMYMSTAFIISTIVVAIGKHIPRVSVIWFPICQAIITTIGCFSIPHAENYLQCAVLITFLGFGNGGLVSILFVGTMKITGPINYANGFGLALTSLGICALGTGPAAGGIYDTTGSYTLTFYAIGTAVGISGFLFLGVWIVKQYMANKESK